MIARIRRWWTDHCRPRSARPDTSFQADMRAARAYGVREQRKEHRAIRKLAEVMERGATEYGELNQRMFGRAPWPREGGDR